MLRTRRFRISLRGLFTLILVFSVLLAILRLTDYDLHHFVGVVATTAATAFILFLFLAMLHFFDLVDITTAIMRARNRRKPDRDRSDPPKPKKLS